jgi:uracil-DNA glycosylase
MTSLRVLEAEARACTRCAPHLPAGPRPVFQVHSRARVLIAGQAPGRKVHESGIPFDDASGDRLREWLGVTREQFYDPTLFAIMPMGFCYPGTGRSGDLPPRTECAPAWRAPLLAQMRALQLTVVIGQYAMAYHVPHATSSLTDTVRAWRDTFPSILPLPHPSPRNNMWLKRNPWFAAEVLPALRARVREVLDAPG